MQTGRDTGCGRTFMGLAAVAFQCAIILDTITRQHRENYELNLLRYEQIENIRKRMENIS